MGVIKLFMLSAYSTYLLDYQNTKQICSAMTWSRRAPFFLMKARRRKNKQFVIYFFFKWPLYRAGTHINILPATVFKMVNKFLKYKRHAARTIIKKCYDETLTAQAVHYLPTYQRFYPALLCFSRYYGT